MPRVYLDHNATAPLGAAARAAMLAAMEVVGNPSSVHSEGRRAKGLIETARRQVAEALGAGEADGRAHLGRRLGRRAGRQGRP